MVLDKANQCASRSAEAQVDAPHGPGSEKVNPLRDLSASCPSLN